jgi:tocopherol cyclase
MANWRATWNPDLYHGHGAKPPFFEGWYFKLVTAASRSGDGHQEKAFAVIPGVFLGRDSGLGEGAASSHAFVQTLDGLTGHSTYHRYPLESFSASRREFDIRVGPNRFRADRMILDIRTAERQMQGEVSFAGLTPWPVSVTSPGIMGWYALVPFMECYHGVVSLDHEINGRLTIDGEIVDFTGGRGYIEKDWGQAFPRAWIWMQSNHFEGTGASPHDGASTSHRNNAGTALTASVATIPWLGGAFRGFIVGLWHGGRLYRFATYTGAFLERLEVADDRVTFRVRSQPKGRERSCYRLEVVALRGEGGLLHSPERVAMLQRVLESLTARVEVRLTSVCTQGETLLFEGSGRHAGLEIVGRLEDDVDSGG